ncbi:MAG: hypothetical protein ACLUD0_05920 [Eubacterium ramulus]
MAQYADQVILIDGTVKNREPCVSVRERRISTGVGRFDLENYKPSRQVKNSRKRDHHAETQPWFMEGGRVNEWNYCLLISV